MYVYSNAHNLKYVYTYVCTQVYLIKALYDSQATYECNNNINYNYPCRKTKRIELNGRIKKITHANLCICYYKHTNAHMQKCCLYSYTQRSTNTFIRKCILIMTPYFPLIRQVGVQHTIEHANKHTREHICIYICMYINITVYA